MSTCKGTLSTPNVKNIANAFTKIHTHFTPNLWTFSHTMWYTKKFKFLKNHKNCHFMKKITILKYWGYNIFWTLVNIMLKIFFCCFFVILNILKQVSGDLKFWSSRLTKSRLTYDIYIYIYIYDRLSVKSRDQKMDLLKILQKCSTTYSGYPWIFSDFFAP